MKISISGISEASSRAAVGDQFWQAPGVSWIRPEALLASLGSRSGDESRTRVLWLYRSPMAELLAAEADAAIDAVLGRWRENNRAILDFHRRNDGVVTLVNAERVADAGLPREILGERAGGIPRPASPGGASDDAVHRVLGRILDLDAPELLELYDALEGSSRVPMLREQDFPEADGSAGREALVPMLDAVLSIPATRRLVDELYVRAGQREEELARTQASAANLLQENALLLLQLQGLQQEARRHASDDAEGRLQARIAELRLATEVLQRQLRLRTALLREDGGKGLRARVARRLNRKDPLVAARDERAARIEELRASQWFDADWYRATYADVPKDADSVAHYYDSGWLEGRNPGPRFDTHRYLREYPDVVESGLNPLWHFIAYGEKEGRRPCGEPGDGAAGR